MKHNSPNIFHGNFMYRSTPFKPITNKILNTNSTDDNNNNNNNDINNNIDSNNINLISPSTKIIPFQTSSHFYKNPINEKNDILSLTDHEPTNMEYPLPKLISDSQIVNTFVNTPLQRSQSMKCNIGIGIKNTTYYLYSNKTRKFIIGAVKVKNKLRLNFNITTNSHLKETSSECVIAHLNANFWKNEYILYDNGVKGYTTTDNKGVVRKYLLEVQFEEIKKGNVGIEEYSFKKGVVYIPKEGKCFYNKNESKNDKLSECYKTKYKKDINVYSNKMEYYSIKYKDYINIYSKRVKVKSKKNFKIVDVYNGDTLLECGKMNDNAFALDFKAPFAPLHAFAIALAFMTSS